MSLGLPRRTQAGVAAGLALAFVFMASSPALADHVRSQEWWLGTLHVTRAWRTTQGAGVTVALLDTGVDPKQADLTGSVITGPDYTHSGRTPDGPFWGIHGTAMASLIAGHGHGAGKRDGVMGVAPAAKILSVRVTLEGNDPLLGNAAVAGGLPGAIARGIRYAVRRHAAVIDLPLDPVTKAGAAGSGGGPAERAAVSYALNHHVVLVAPAGDGGATGAVNYPAAYPGVISVGAFNEKFIKAPFSSHRAYVALTAAGDGVTAANGPTGYALLHSTSAASAVVAGIVALIKAQFPRLTPGQVRDVLTKSTVFRPKGGRGDGSGFGTVDATAALMAASTMAEAVPSTAAAGGASPAPPSAPAVHNTVVRKNLGHSLITDAALAVAVFLILLGAIFGYKTLRRRRARSARLAEVRAATRVSGASARSAGKGRARQTRKPAARKPAARKPRRASRPPPGSPRRPRPGPGRRPRPGPGLLRPTASGRLAGRRCLAGPRRSPGRPRSAGRRPRRLAARPGRGALPRMAAPRRAPTRPGQCWSRSASSPPRWARAPPTRGPPGPRSPVLRRPAPPRRTGRPPAERPARLPGPRSPRNRVPGSGARAPRRFRTARSPSRRAALSPAENPGPAMGPSSGLADPLAPAGQAAGGLRGRTGQPRSGSPRFPAAPRGSPRRSQTASCPGPRRPRRPRAGRACRSGSLRGPRCQPGTRLRKMCGRAGPAPRDRVRRPLPGVLGTRAGQRRGGPGACGGRGRPG